MPAQAQQILEEAAKEIDGLIGMSVTGMDGIPIAITSTTDVPLDVQESIGVKFALVMSLVRKSLSEVGMPALEENLIEHKGGWMLSRFIGESNFYLGMAVTKNSVLGNVRMVAKKTADKLVSVL